MLQRLFKLGLLVIACQPLHAQPAALSQHLPYADSLRLSLPNAEKLFLENNLLLLAEHCNIDIQSALLEQAHYWENPVLITDQNVYDGKFFRHKTENSQLYGEWYVQIQQTIQTAGKRRKLIKLAASDVEGSKAQFNTLLWQLHYLLVTDFNDLNQYWQSWQLYQHQIDILQKLSSGMEAQYQAGNISQKENLRIHALLFSAKAEAIDQYNSILDTEKELHNLLNTKDSAFIIPVSDAIRPADISLPPLQQAIDSCLANRPDIQAASINHDRAQKELSYQQSLRYPDVTVGPEYDRLNTYVPNYVGMSISLPLPIFNRNQGAIKAARYSISQSAYQLTQQQKQAEQDLIAAYGKFNQARAGWQMQDSLLGNQYQTMMEHMVESYQQRQISLLELADFIQSYKELYQQQLALTNHCYNAAAEINYAAASKLTRISTNTTK